MNEKRLAEAVLDWMANNQPAERKKQCAHCANTAAQGSALCDDCIAAKLGPDVSVGAWSRISEMPPKDWRLRCAMCGALDGLAHHDAMQNGVVVALRRSRLRNRWECQPCNAGMAALRRDEKRKKAAR